MTMEKLVNMGISSNTLCDTRTHVNYYIGMEVPLRQIRDEIEQMLLRCAKLEGMSHVRSRTKCIGTIV